MGVSDKWISKFETIALQAPNWYNNGTAFNAAKFGTFMNSTMILASKKMSSRPSSNSLDGGSSGGDSGGGGGGSWQKNNQPNKNMKPSMPKKPTGIIFKINENEIEIGLSILNDASSVNYEFPGYIYNIGNNTITKK